MKKRIISLLLTFVMVVSLFAGMATPVEVKASTNSFYEPLILNSTTLNASTVWGSGDTEHVMDKDGGFYSSEKSSSGALPDNGEIVTSDEVPYQLAWTGNSPYAGNDSIRFEGKKSSSYVVSDPVTMKISTFGIYDKVYVLGTAGGFSDNTKSLNFKVTLTYTDGTSSETTYSLYDWYKDKSVVESNGIGYKVFSRLNKDGKTIDPDYGKNGGPILQSKQIECDEEKILKDITFQIANTSSSVANDQGIYAAIYAVTGMVKSGAPASPVASVHSETSNSFTVSWKAVEGALSYAVDVSSYPTFQDASGEPSFVSGYMNKLETETSAVIEGLAEGTTYYCRVRATGEASAQSRSSEVVAATTKVVTSEDPEPTDSIDYAFDYAYDCQRSPAYPKKGETVSLREFKNPLGANETNGKWELIDCGKYDSSKHTETKKETLANIVSSVADRYGTGNSEIKVYDLKKDGAHICYGVVCTVFDDGALFIGTTWGGGGGYYLCNTSLSFSDSFTEVAIGDTNNPVPANPEVHTHSLTLEPEKVATCTLAGNKAYYKCSGCDTLFTDANGTTTTTAEVVKIADLGHDMSKATCTEASKCQREGCDHTEGTKLGHDMGEASCTEVSKCKREGCDHTEGTKLGHDMSKATCTEASKCKREGCDHTEGTKLGHDMSKATCTEASKCQREGCDHTEGTSLGHDWSTDWSKDETKHWHKCNNEGCREVKDTEAHMDSEDADYACDKCGDVLHTHDLEIVAAVSATCTEDGNKAYYKCIAGDCDCLFEDAEGNVPTTLAYVKIDQLGHDMSEATCTEASKCQREGCDHTEGTKLGHDMGEATCTEASKCQREGCDHTEGTALGHDWTGEWTIIKEATATEDGKKETLCIRGCGQKKVVIIPATGTTDDNGNLEKDAEVEPDAPIDEATLNNTKEELINAGNIFTDEEKTQITNGTDSRVWLEISKTDESAIASTDKAKMEQEATKIMGDNPTITYFDADLFKQVGSGAKQEISEPGLAMKITITIPDELLNRDKKVSREYKIIRLHEGQVDVIDGTFDVTTGEFTFETDKFSTYAIVYNEKNADIPVENVQIILPTNTTLTKSGENIQLNVNVLPSEATNKKVTWHSSNPAVATVDSNGKVTAISNGTVVITATSQSGSKSASVTLTVAIEPIVTDEPKEDITPAQLEKNILKINEQLKVDQKSNYIKVTWGKVSNADGYKVYVQYCGKKFTKKPSKNLIGGKKNSVTIKKINGKKLNLKKNYKFYVVAYKIVDGKEVQLGKSIVAHIVGKKNTKYTNVKKVKVKKSKFTLKVNKTDTIKASTILVEKGKRQLTDAHAKEFRYATSNKDVAIVSKDGKIKAVGKGKCTIYVYARNGYCKKVSVTVK